MKGKNRKMVVEKNEGQKERVSSKQMRNINNAEAREKMIEISREEISRLGEKIW